MKIHRSKHTEHFTILPNATLRDPRLSWAARGVLMELLSRPEDWQTNADQMARTAKQERNKRGEGREAVRALFGELESAGYIVRTKTQTDGGSWVTELTVFDVAQDVTSEDAQNPRSDRGTANRASVNQASADRASVNQASLRRTDRGSTDTKDCSTKDSSSSAEVKDITHDVVAKTKKKTPKSQDREQAKTLIAQRLPDSTDDEREAIINLVYAEAAGKGRKIGFIATYIGGRPAALLEQDLAQVRRHSAAPTVTECGDHHQTMPAYGCPLCAAEIKAGDPEDIARLTAHLALVGEKARPDLARLLEALVTPVGVSYSQDPAAYLRGINNGHRNRVVGGSRMPVPDHTYWASRTPEQLKNIL